MKRMLCNKVTLIVIVAFSLLLTLVPNSVQAGPPALPPRPPLPSGGGGDGGSDADRLKGATIELHVQDAPADAWTVVQWQDSAGGWHDVEGWRGMLDEGGAKRWWVASKEFNTGPFRWIVTQGPDGGELAASDPFTLPGSARQILLVSLSVAQ